MDIRGLRRVVVDTVCLGGCGEDSIVIVCHILSQTNDMDADAFGPSSLDGGLELVGGLRCGIVTIHNDFAVRQNHNRFFSGIHCIQKFHASSQARPGVGIAGIGNSVNRLHDRLSGIAVLHPDAGNNTGIVRGKTYAFPLLSYFNAAKTSAIIYNVGTGRFWTPDFEKI